MKIDILKYINNNQDLSKYCWKHSNFKFEHAEKTGFFMTWTHKICKS